VSKKLSVIIPLYNVSNYVERAAKSIASQQHSDIEVVVIDDGSTDDSLNVCVSDLADVDTIVITQQNKGLSAARNAGIKAASGEYLLFLDGDDFLLPDAINNILSLLENSAPDVIYGRFLLWDPNRGFIPATPYKYSPPDDPKKRTEYILGNPKQPAWNAWRYITRRSFINENNLFFIEGILSEDVPWTLAMLETAGQILFLDEPFYAYYHSRPMSIMRSLNPKRLVDLNDSVARLADMYNNRPNICALLVWQSFLYIYEICLHKRTDRDCIYTSYKLVLPLYRYSSVRLHRVVGRFTGRAMLFVLSVGLFLLKQLNRVWVKIRSGLLRS